MDIKKYYTMAEAVKASGVPHATLGSACDRGEIQTGKTMGGTRLLLAASVVKWAEDRPRRGRPWTQKSND